MDPFYRSPTREDPLRLIAWNAIWAVHAYAALVANPANAEWAGDIRRYHRSLRLKDGITDSARDPFPNRVPSYCYLGYALGGYAVLPLRGRRGVRWHPVDDVQSLWRKDPEASMRALEETAAWIRERYGVEISWPPPAPLP